MNPGAVVLSRTGAAVAADFNNATGAPIVGDTDTGALYWYTHGHAFPLNWANAQGMGAIGDGVTDDSVAIERASLALYNAGGGILFFPRGTYLLATLSSDPNAYVSYITARDRVSFVGEGIGVSVIKVADGQNALYPLQNKPNIIGTQQAAVLKNVFMRDLTFDWNGANNLLTIAMTARNNAALLALNGAQNVSFEKVEVKETPGNQCFFVVFPNGGSNIQAKSCIFRDNGSGLVGNYSLDHSSIYFSGNDPVVQNCEFLASQAVNGACYELHGSRARGSGNTSNFYTNSFYLTADDEDVTDLIVDGDQHNNQVIAFGLAAGTHALDNVKVLNCTFRMATGLTFASVNYYFGGNTVFSCNNFEVRGCTFIGRDYANLRFFQHNNELNFTFSDNTVMNFNDATNGFGVIFLGTNGTLANRAQIQNNKFINVQFPVYCNQILKTIDQLEITGNIATNSGAAGTPWTVILAAGNVLIGPNLTDTNYTTIINPSGGTASVRFLERIVGTAVYDPPNLAAGASTTTTVAATGAALGNMVDVSFSLNLQGITLTGYISSANTVTVEFYNGTAGALDLGSGTLTARVTSA